MTININMLKPKREDIKINIILMKKKLFSYDNKSLYYKKIMKYLLS